MPEISISDTKKIISAINIRHKVDFNCFSLMPLRYKLDRILRINQYLNSRELVEVIQDNDFVYMEILAEIFAGKNEIFSDPEFWVFMNKLIPQFKKDNYAELNTLLPAVSNFLELISILIFLEENQLKKKSNISVSLISNRSLPDFLNDAAIIDLKPIDYENIKKVFPEIDMEKYFTINSKILKVKMNLFSNVVEVKHNLDFLWQNQKFNLIFFRDQLLNFSSGHQNMVIKNLTSGLCRDGIIAFGYRENISSYIYSNNDINAIDKKENIFKKK